MKLILSLLTGGLLAASMSSCTTYVEERGPSHHSGLGGYSSTSSHYHSTSVGAHTRVSSHNDRHYNHSSTSVKAKVRAPLGVSTGVGVDVR